MYNILYKVWKFIKKEYVKIWGRYDFSEIWGIFCSWILFINKGWLLWGWNLLRGGGLFIELKFRNEGFNLGNILGGESFFFFINDGSGGVRFENVGFEGWLIEGKVLRKKWCCNFVVICKSVFWIIFSFLLIWLNKNKR